MRRIVLLAAALVLGAACQQAPVSAPSVSHDLSSVDRLKAEGDAFLAKSDYPNAIEKYRQAVDLDSSAVGPHFGLTWDDGGWTRVYVAAAAGGVARARIVTTRM